METYDNSPIDLTPPPPPPAPRATRFGGIGRRGALGVTAVGLLTGGVLGGYVVSHAATTAPTVTTTASTGSGKFVSNENAAHEAGESAAREAQENAGQVPTVP